MNYMFGENMFSEYPKETLEEFFNDIRKCEKEGLISDCFSAEEKKIRERCYVKGAGFGHPDAFGLAEKEFFDEIARRYFSENEAE